MSTRAEAREGVTLLFNSRLHAAEQLFLTKSESDPLAALGLGLVAFLQAVLSMDQVAISSAIDKLTKAHTLAAPHTTGSAEGFVSNLFWKPKITSESVAHDLISADSLAMSALLQLLQEGYLSSMKAALSLRTSNGLYKQAQEFLKLNPQDEADPLDLNDGVGFGIGMFNLVLSLLPEKVLAVAEYFGFSGDRALALNVLQSCHAKGGLRSPLASLLLLTYHTVLASFFCLPDASLQEADAVFKASLQRYPQGALFLWMGGKAERLRCNLPGAILQYEDALKAQAKADAEANDAKGSKQFNELCYYEIGWCELNSRRYAQAHAQFNRLMNESAWSKASNAYFAAVCLLEDGKSTEAAALFAVIPKLLSESGGKSELEVFVARRVRRFLEKKKAFPEPLRLFQPGLELIYLWNGFAELKGTSQEILAKIEAFEEQGTKQEAYSDDDRAMLVLLKAAALRAQGRSDEAKALLEKLSQDTHEKEKYLAPFAHYDLAMIHLEAGDLEKAEKEAKAAKNTASGYDFETRLHFRISSTLEYLASKRKATKN